MCNSHKNSKTGRNTNKSVNEPKHRHGDVDDLEGQAKARKIR
jgi:hypothetical protein